MSKCSRRNTALVATLMLISWGGVGCTTVLEDRMPPVQLSPRSKAIAKPVVAVVDFENRSGFTGKWKLGNGMAEVLCTELLDTRRFTVLERKNIGDVIGEIVRQGKDLFRAEGRAKKGRLKNAQYLLRGVITDFTVTGDLSGWFGASKGRLFGRGSRARVALTITVSDVESGEIISAVSSSGKASSGMFGAKVNYKGLSFGGDAFFRTPLGDATQEAIEDAVDDILDDIPHEYWKPRIAEAGPDMVIINGGDNVKLREGDLFVVRRKGREISDPVTGNIIETAPGPVVARIRVTEVNPLSSHAALLEGAARRGDFLEPIRKKRDRLRSEKL